MTFRITGLSPEPFRPLFGLSDDALAAKGVKRAMVDAKLAFPDRIEMRDAEPGETVLLLNYTHQPADNPYHASHAIFVREGAERRYDAVNEVPAVMRVRLLSLRGFDRADDMIAADVVEGPLVADAIERMLGNPDIAYIQAHYAKRGCYAGRIERG